jgi:hypothetical protein
MIARTWPYGTRKVVTIIDFARVNDHCYTTCRHIDDPTEATILLDGVQTIVALFHRPAIGQRRVIEFREGGPTGGHWALLDGLDLTRAEQPAGGVR